MRKSAAVWRDPQARAIAEGVTIAGDGAVFAVDPSRLFPRAATLEIELGSGRGDFIIERAASMPERNFLAVELAGSVARILAVRVGRSELANLRVMRADARTLVNLLLPDNCVAAHHIYFPDPWPKERHAKHRLLTPWFAKSLLRTMAPGGRAFLATDVQDYAHEGFAVLEAAGLAPIDEPVPGASRSNFGRKYLRAGKKVFSAAFARPQPAAS
jgi:tRNA (guanine-N7-)-methyltransferase